MIDKSHWKLNAPDLLFKHLRTSLRFADCNNGNERKEAFLGCIIGCNIPGTVRRRDLGDRPVQINDFNRECRVANWTRLTGTPAGKQLYDAAFNWLHKHTGGPKHLLQCNVNLYTSGGERLAWHRDDFDETCSTFYPAAVTCLLYSSQMSSKLRKKAAFELWADLNFEQPLTDRIFRKKDPKNYQYYFGNDDQGSLKYDFGNEAGTLLGITGNPYKLGLHSAMTGWRRGNKLKKDEDPFERMSLNFRIVRDNVWKDVERIVGVQESEV
jgi:hypothetical protein